MMNREEILKMNKANSGKQIEDIKNKMNSREQIVIDGHNYFVNSLSWDMVENSLALYLTIGKDNKTKKRFEIGDKVKLNKPLGIMGKPYRKFYEVVMIDTIKYGSKEESFDIIALDGMRGYFNADSFDLYEEDVNNKNKRDFTLDELIFIQGHLGGLRETYIDELIHEEDHRHIKALKYKVDNITKINKKISELFSTYY